MKSSDWKLIIALVAGFIIFCGAFRFGKTEGYEKGYSEGISNEHETHDDDRYAEIVPTIMEDAVIYVRNHSDLHPDEARCIIACYNAGKTRCDYGFDLTDSIYKEAVNSLYHFADYYYNDHYK